MAHSKLVHRLSGLQRKEVTILILTGLFLGLSSGSSAFLFLLLLEAKFYFAPLIKLSLEISIGIGLVGLLIHSCLKPLLCPPSLETFALRVEKNFDGFHQELISALQLWNQKDKKEQSFDMIKVTVLQADRMTTSLDFKKLIDKRPLLRMAGLLFGIILFTVVLFSLWPTLISSAADRLAHPGSTYLQPPDTRIDLQPGDSVIVAGEHFEIVANLFGVIPIKTLLSFREVDKEVWSSHDLPVHQNQAKYQFRNITRPFFYRLQAYDAETSTFTLTVHPRPMVTQITQLYRYPVYTGLQADTELEGGDIIAPVGTKVNLQIDVNISLQRAWLEFESIGHLEAKVEDNTAQIEITVAEKCHYKIGLLSQFGVSNLNPVEYRIIPKKDHPPKVQLIHPGLNSELDKTMRTFLRVELLDDFGLSHMEVHFKIEGKTNEQFFQVPLSNPNTRETIVEYNWDLSNVNLLPGNQVTCQILAYDNNSISGPNFGKSKIFILRFPTLFEIHHQIQQAQSESLEDMQSIWETGNKIRERLNKVVRELLKENRIEWQKQKKVENILEMQNMIHERLEDSVKKFNLALNRLENSSFVSTETNQKVEEIRKILSQIHSPELYQTMKKLREALTKVNHETVQEALEDFQMEHKEFQQNLDRSLALLRKLKHQQNLNALKNRMEAIITDQEEIVYQFQQRNNPTDLSEWEDLLSRDTKQLQREIVTVSEHLESPIEKDLKRIVRKFKTHQITRRMNQISRDLKEKKTSSIQDQGMSIVRDLREIYQKFQKTQKAFITYQKAEISRNLNWILQDLLGLSQFQETISKRIQEISIYENPKYLALEQARHISSLNHIGNRILENSKKTFLLSPQTYASIQNALQRMKESTSLFHKGKISQGKRSTRKAMGSLNRTAIMIRKTLVNLEATNNAIGFEEILKQMQELSNQQKQVNTQTKTLFKTQWPNSQIPTQIDYSHLAAQQLGIKKTLDKINKQMVSQQKKMLGDLKNLASTMGKIAFDLREKRIFSQTLKDQRQILSRMLDAQRSIKERGKIRNRKAKQGITLTYQGPGTLPSDLGEADNPLRESLRQALKEGYSKEYQVLIGRYFQNLILDSISKQQKSQ